jgi:hypothetical protein
MKNASEETTANTSPRLKRNWIQRQLEAAKKNLAAGLVGMGLGFAIGLAAPVAYNVVKKAVAAKKSEE